MSNNGDWYKLCSTYHCKSVYQFKTIEILQCLTYKNKARKLLMVKKSDLYYNLTCRPLVS